MKKLVLVLAIALIVAPSFGALSLSLERQGTTNKVDLKYAGADELNLPRAFMLTIGVSGGGANISAISNYKTGVSTVASRGFGIYPATIDIDDITGVVTAWGNPLALTGDPGAGDQVLPSSSFVVEFGSLYSPVTAGVDANAPLTSGTLATFDVDCNGQTGNINITAAEEDTYRGGVILENGSKPSPNLTALLVYPCSPPLPLPGKATTPSPANGATGVSRAGVSLTWAAGSDAATRDVYFGTVNPPVTKVISDGTVLTYATGAMTQGTLRYWRVDEKNATGTTTGDVWSFRVEECLKSTALPSPGSYNDWVAWGRPSCWCYQRNCRGDINGVKNITWVSVADLTALTSAYGKSDTALALITNGICADINHTKNITRVSVADLTVLTSYYGKSDALTPICVVENVNFWTN